jgi:hypothetical protein
MKHVLEPYCEVGPAVLLDEQRCAAWKERTFNEVILDQSFQEDALRGECCFLKNEEMRQFMGQTVVLIEEPPPELVKYALRQATGLRLELPTGKLRFVGLCSLIKDGGVKSGEQDFLTLQLTPGTWVVDLWTFIEQAARVEEPDRLLPDESPLPGELPPGKWTGLLGVSTLILALISFVAMFFLVGFRDAPRLLVGTGLSVVLLWVLRAVAYRASGEQARARHNTRLWKEHLAKLPELPSWVVVLRPAQGAEPTEGGGVS